MEKDTAGKSRLGYIAVGKRRGWVKSRLEYIFLILLYPKYIGTNDFVKRTGDFCHKEGDFCNADLEIVSL